MYFSLSILIFVAVGSSQIAIPVRRGHQGQPIVNATIPAITGESIIEMSLTPYSTAGMYIFADESLYQNQWVQNVTVNVGRVMSFHPQYTLITLPEDTPEEDRGDCANLGIGRGSPLVREYGSVDFVQSSDTSASMIFNSTLDWYRTRACAENSVISVPFNVNVTIYNDLVMFQVDLVMFQVGLGSSPLTRVDFLLAPSPFLMSLPADHLLTLTTIIRAATTTLLAVDGRLSFGGCSFIRPRLPNLRIVVNDREISLSPSDYTREWGEGDRCDLLVNPCPSSGQHVINPFMLPDMNVRFTNSTLFICDSNITPETRLD